MSPNQRQNPDPYQDKRPPERQQRQGMGQPPMGGPPQGGQQGPPPEQFRGQQPPQQGPIPQQQPPQGTPQQRTQQPPQQGMAQPGMATPQQPPGGQQAGRGGMRGPQLQSAPIDEVLESDVVTVDRETPITQVAQALESEDVGCVVVIEDDRPVGILTDRKIALALGETGDLSNRTAGDLLSGNLVTGTAEMTVFDVLQKLEAEDIRRLPIVDDDRSLQGIVSLDDIIVLLSAELSNVASIIQSQSRRF